MEFIVAALVVYLGVALFYCIWTWFRSGKMAEGRRFVKRTMTTGLLLTPGIVGIGAHSAGVAPAWFGILQGLGMFYPDLVLWNVIALACGLLLSAVFVRLVDILNGKFGKA